MSVVTYTLGFRITLTQSVSKKEFVQLLKTLRSRFSDLGEYAFRPEPITEGGIQMTKFPGSDGGCGYVCAPYKTLRLGLRDWPRVTDEIVRAWKNDDSVLIKNETQATVFLKAFYGAPTWSIAELRLFAECFETIGIKCDKMPKKSALKMSDSGMRVWHKRDECEKCLKRKRL